MKRNRRRVRLIKPSIQLKIVLFSVFIASLILFLNLSLLLSGFLKATTEVGEMPRGFVKEVRWIMIREFLISMGLGIPLATSMGTLVSFRFCGPIYRFEKFLKGVRDGDLSQTCTLRKGDDLQEVATLINEVVDSMKSRFREDRALIEETVELATEVEDLIPEGSLRDRMRDLKDRATKTLLGQPQVGDPEAERVESVVGEISAS